MKYPSDYLLGFNDLILVLMSMALVLCVTIASFIFFVRLCGVSVDFLYKSIIAMFWVLWFEFNINKLGSSLMDGRELVNAIETSYIILDILAFVFVSILAYSFCLRKEEYLNKILILSYVVMIGGMAVELYDSNRLPNFVSNTDVGSIFKLSQNENIFIIVLDTMDSDAANEFLRGAELKKWDGFVKYDDAMSNYKSTMPSVPSYMSGILNKNESTINEYYKQVIDNNIIKRGADKGYDVAAVANGISLDNIEIKTMPMSYAVGYGKFDVLKLIETSTYLLSPLFVKQLLYQNGRWYLSGNLIESSGMQAFDKMFAESFVSNANVSSYRKKIYYIHLRGAHFPILFNENLEEDNSIEQNRNNYKRQAIGALKNAKSIIDQLVRLGVYDQSRIIIMGDHGSGQYIPDMTKKILDKGYWGDVHEMNSSINIQIISSAHPIFMVKDFYSKSNFRSTNEPVSLINLNCFVYSKDIDKCSRNEDRVFFDYNWHDDDWSGKYLPQLTQYRVKGDSYLPVNWEKIQELPNKYSLYTFSDLKELGNIRFGKGGNLDSYKHAGWWGAETEFHWGMGYYSIIKFGVKVPSKSFKKLSVDLELPSDPSYGPAMTVTILINSTIVGTITGYGHNTKTFDIDPGLLKYGANELTFKSSKIFNPHQATSGASNDKRNLSFIMKEINVQY